MKPIQQQKQQAEFVRLFQAGRLTEARALGARLLDGLPRQPQLLGMLGAIHARLGEFPEAERCYRALVDLEPGAHQHYCYLGLALVMQRRLPEALPVFARMLQLRPDFAEGQMQMGCLLRDLGQLAAAATHFERALQLMPGLVDAAVFLGNLRVFQGRMDDALACFEQALTQRPDHPDAVAGKALILERRGDKAMAWALLQPLVARGAVTPGLGIVYALLAPKLAAGDQARTLLRGLLARAGLAPSQQQELHFALGKLCDKLEDYDAAFTHYAAANRLTTIPIDLARMRAKAQEIKAAFPRGDAAAVPEPQRGPVFIFIVGMPRSGTSLIEQILASHPEVAAGGELELLPDIERAAPELLGRPEPYPECIEHATPEGLAKLADRYRAAIAGLGLGAARYVTDKLPPNYERLGLIQRLFPHARIIHTRRDPRDTCLSCFFQNFGNTHLYSTNLRALGEVYGIYRDLMAHWRATLSMPILDADYEAIVADPKASVARLLEFCGLDWHDDCLDFHKSKRYVQTASYDQVRQPLYASSVRRWRYYQRHLAELLETLPEESP